MTAGEKSEKRKLKVSTLAEWIDSLNDDSEFDKRVGKPEEIERFNAEVRRVAELVVETLIEKNLLYKGAYRRVREKCLERHGDASIPHFVHSCEKMIRKGSDGDTEDAELDYLCYQCLEYVCRNLDNLPKPHVTVFDDAEKPCCEAVDAHCNTDKKITFTNGKTCLYCGKLLFGKRYKFCSVECDWEWRHTSDIVEKPCVVCGKSFKSPRMNHRLTCSSFCRGRMRAETIGRSVRGIDKEDRHCMARRVQRRRAALHGKPCVVGN